MSDRDSERSVEERVWRRGLEEPVPSSGQANIVACSSAPTDASVSSSCALIAAISASTDSDAAIRK